MNKRNLEIFGLSKKTRTMIISLVIVLIVSIAAWSFLQSKSPTAAAITKPSNQLTGATVQQEQGTQTTQQQEEQQEQVEQQQRPYYAYEGQCAFDIKQRQDDVNDVTNNRDAYQQELTKLTEEYERKKKELEDQYTFPLANIKGKAEKTQQELEAAQQRYDEVKTSCEQQNP